MRYGASVVVAATIFWGYGCGSEWDEVAASGAGGSTSASTMQTSAGAGSSVGGTGAAGAGGAAGEGGAGGGAAGEGGAGGQGPPPNITVIAGKVFDLLPGATVAVNDSAGAVLSTTLTDASGVAEVYIPADGIVAVYPADPDDNTMTAVVSPPVGSTVHIWFGGEVPPGPDETTYAVTMTGYPTETASLQLRTCVQSSNVGASSSGTTLDDIDDGGCPSPASNTIIAIARDAANQPIAWGRADVSNSPGNTVPVGIVVDQTSFATVTSTVTPLDANVVSAGIFSSTSPPPFQLINTIDFPTGSASWQLSLPDTPLQYVEIMTVAYEDAGYDRFARRFLGVAAPPAGSTFDPTVMAPVYANPADVTDPVHPVATWTTGTGDLGMAATISLVAHFASAPLRAFVIVAPSSLSSPWKLFDVPASVAQFDLGGSNGPPTEWRGSVQYEADPAIASWADHYLFATIGSSTIERVQSMGRMQ